MHRLSLVSLLLTAALSACGSEAASGTPPVTPPVPSPTPGPRAGFITGTVTNERGQPIQGAEVVADNTLSYDSNLITHTDARGQYSIDVHALPTTFNVLAKVTLTYDSLSLPIDLIPENPDEVAGIQGGTRNFVLRPKVITPQDPYGNLGMVFLEHRPGEYTIDFRTLDVTLTPIGPLADGTTGTPVTAHPIQSGSGWLVPNVMWGRYTVTVSMNGHLLKVRARRAVNSDPFADAYTGGFWTDYFISRPSIFLELHDPAAE
ncbi:hypothetical protein HNQ07_002279 [Deinococcus metalli]|uniref:Carboxypeptidase regulatory-like domain-containing protein n=1 Tax=Deinococcus metalli TaxID=1141878 RepID=A0A7W8KF81_9DEIO|nr:carboxypeptidase-like regulatory domain-containing protein [Deinococcus metalli]MBB5376815.1 hypothetical protein [Deinococcus metalli]GHF45556.1 hypothetical protein GCM10017781_22440 [Deinococcus metalli]